MQQWRNEVGVDEITEASISRMAATGKAYLHASPDKEGRPVLVVVAAKHFAVVKVLDCLSKGQLTELELHLFHWHWLHFCILKVTTRSIKASVSSGCFDGLPAWMQEEDLMESKKHCIYLIEKALSQLPPGGEKILGIFDLRGFKQKNGDLKFVRFLVGTSDYHSQNSLIFPSKVVTRMT